MAFIDRHMDEHILDRATSLALSCDAESERPPEPRGFGVDLGTGTGRFAIASVQGGLCSRVYACDASDAMLSVAVTERVREGIGSAWRDGPASIVFANRNILVDPLPRTATVTTSFVLHEMPPENVEILFERVAEILCDNGLWVVVDADVYGESVLPRWYVESSEPYFDAYRDFYRSYLERESFSKHGLVLERFERTLPSAACVWVFRKRRDD